MKLPTNNLNYPIRILAGTSSGSGFIVATEDENIYIVTAKHVPYYQDQNTNELILYAEKIKIICNTFIEPYTYKNPIIYELNAQKLITNNNLAVHNDQDVVIIKFGKRENGKIGCGGFYLVRDENKAQLAWGMIHSRFHKQGYGTALYKYRQEQIEKINPNATISLGTSQHTFPFFEKMGFKVTNIVEQGYGEHLDKYDMQ